MKALKRVEIFAAPLATFGPDRLDRCIRVYVSGEGVSVDDLRTVLALAKEAGELKRRVRLARSILRGDHSGDAADHYGDDADDTAECDECAAVAVLDLRKPLPKRRR